MTIPRVFEQFEGEPLSSRLAALSAHLHQIADLARNVAVSDRLPVLMRKGQLMIDVTAADLEPNTASELVDILRMLAAWPSAWPYAQHNVSLRSLLHLLASKWAGIVHDHAAALDVP